MIKITIEDTEIGNTNEVQIQRPDYIMSSDFRTQLEALFNSLLRQFVMRYTPKE